MGDEPRVRGAFKILAYLFFTPPWQTLSPHLQRAVYHRYPNSEEDPL